MAIDKSSGMPAGTPAKTGKSAQAARKTPAVQERNKARIREIVPERPEVTVRFVKKMVDGMTLDMEETIAEVRVGKSVQKINFVNSALCLYIEISSIDTGTELTPKFVGKHFDQIENRLRIARALLGSMDVEDVSYSFNTMAVEFVIELGKEYEDKNEKTETKCVIPDATRFEALIRTAFAKIGAKFVD